MTENIPTLAEVNALFATEHGPNGPHDVYSTRHGYAVGQAGWPRGGRTGSKLHLLHTSTVTAHHGEALDTSYRYPDGRRPNWYKVGAYNGVTSACNGNGQFTGTPHARYDLKDVTCAICLKVVKYLVADYYGTIAAQGASAPSTYATIAGGPLTAEEYAEASSFGAS